MHTAKASPKTRTPYQSTEKQKIGRTDTTMQNKTPMTKSTWQNAPDVAFNGTGWQRIPERYFLEET